MAGKEVQTLDSETPRLVCGVIMPMSEIDGCSNTHWIEVREILFDAIGKAGFAAQMVSDTDEVGVIHKDIVRNIFENPVVVCDVSGKNPNVMFELGMRLAVDKPTIIIKDDKTEYSFDTNPIKHVQYPRDLRFPSIVTFKKELQDAISATHQAAKDKKDYSTFLKSFGTFKIPKLQTEEVPENLILREEFKEFREEIRQLRSVVITGNPKTSRSTTSSSIVIGKRLCIKAFKADEESKIIEQVTEDILKVVDFREIIFELISPTHIHFPLDWAGPTQRKEILSLVITRAPIVRFV
ncbi:MAG: hypothetical protein WC880_03280 [Candidatus Paceibacterota bacterium]